MPGATSNITIPSHTSISNSPIIDGDYSCASLTMEEAGRLTINASKSLSISGNLLLKSNASNTASLVNYGTLTIGGTSKVQRYINGWEVDNATENWHFLSPPISDALSGVFNNCFLNYHSESDNQYHQVDPGGTLNVALNPMQGYASMYAYHAGYPSTKILNFQGTLNDGSMGSLNNLSRTGDGWNLVGNPYPSSIDWNAASGWTKTNVGTTIYTWNGQVMATYNGSTGTSNGSRYLAPMQGFFVEVVEGQTQGTLSMTNDVRVHNDYVYYKNIEETGKELRLSLNNGSYTDEAVLVWQDGATFDFDYEFDARKFSNSNLVSDLSLFDDESDYAINVVPSDASVFEIGIKLNVKSENQHLLSFVNNIPDGLMVKLIDEYEGIVIDTREVTEYSFSSKLGIVDDRFVLSVTNTTSIKENVSNEFYVNALSYGLYLHSSINMVSPSVEVYSIQGSLLLNQELSSNAKECYVPVHLKSGVYIVKVTDNGHVFSSKVIVNQ